MSKEQRNKAIAREREKWAEENIGEVPKDVTYQDWLRKQSVSFQDEVLGPTRAQLFRDGGMTLDRFVDNSGHEYTLDQLRQRDPAAFKRADLNTP
jgi:hypothetical protein